MRATRSGHPSRPPPKCKDSEVRPAAEEDERRRSHRRLSDADVAILSPVQQTASVLDVSTAGLELLLNDRLSAGTPCDLRITTHTGRVMHKRARVIWTRREGKRCVSSLQFVGSIAPYQSE
jgi:hypothetical protein